MKPWPYLLLGVLSELAIPVLIVNDPDGFDLAQLADFSVLHHEFLVVAALVVSVAAYVVYAKKSRKEGTR